MDYDFDKITLSVSENSAMKKLFKNTEIKLIDDVKNSLYPLGFLEYCYSGSTEYGEPIHNGYYKISDKGRRFCLYKKSVAKSKRIEWIRYIITTAIAVTALFVAIISLIISLSANP